jgi:hypothetical protein
MTSELERLATNARHIAPISPKRAIVAAPGVIQSIAITGPVAKEPFCWHNYVWIIANRDSCPEERRTPYHRERPKQLFHFLSSKILVA